MIAFLNDNFLRFPVYLHCKGIVLYIIPAKGSLSFPNNGNSYEGNKNGVTYFASERFTLELPGNLSVNNMGNKDSPLSILKLLMRSQAEDLGSKFQEYQAEENLLTYQSDLNLKGKLSVFARNNAIPFDEKL